MKELGSDNKRLFEKQVADHIEKLNNLLMLASGQQMDERTIGKVSLASRLLEGSTRMLGLSHWSKTIGAFGLFLEEAVQSRGCWDEQLSQIVSEMFEAEEMVLSEMRSGCFEAAHHPDLFEGLQRELDALKFEYDGGSPADGPDIGREQVSLSPGGDVVRHGEGFSVIDRLVGSLYQVKDQFREYIEDENKNAKTVRDLELAFGESEFYIGLLGGILHRLGDNRKPFLSKVASTTAMDGVSDFFNLHGKVRKWNAKLDTLSDDFPLEREAASTLAVLLENCVFDICRMHEDRTEFKLSINVEISNEGSFLMAKISDNGPDFLCDSEIDREDAFAYYPGLLSVRRVLNRCGGLLWVEPDRGRKGRLHFTLPHTTVTTVYRILTVSGTSCAVPAHAVDRIVPYSTLDITGDFPHRQVTLYDMKVPVFGMHELAPEKIDAECELSYIAVIGNAEKRVGIVSEGPGRSTEGVLEQLTEGSWASLIRQYLHHGEEEYPVLDVGLVLRKINYLQGFEGAPEESGSFVGEDELENSYEEKTVPRV